MTSHPQNMPVLYRNIMDGLPSDLARDAFLWLVEQPGEDRMCYRAERHAREAHDLVNVTLGLIEKRQFTMFKRGGRLLDEDQIANLRHFILVRWSNWRLGANTSIPASIFGREPT